jgi:MFS family permease
MLWATTLINRVGSFAIVYLAIYLNRSLGFTPLQAALSFTAYGLGGAVGTIVGGVLTDRWGRKPTLLLAYVASAVLLFQLAFATDFWLIMAICAASGAFGEAFRPALQAMMVDIVDAENQVRAFSLSFWANTIGFAIAALLAGTVASVSPVLLFGLDAGTTLLAALVIAITVDETRPTDGTVSARRTPAVGRGMGVVFRDRAFITFIAVNFIILLIGLQYVTSLPLAMTAAGLSSSAYGVVIALNAVIVIVGQLLIGRYLKARNQQRMLALGYILYGVGYGVYALGGSFRFFIAGVVIWSMGGMIHNPVKATLIAKMSPIDLRGRYQGVVFLFFTVAAAAAPALGGLVIQYQGATTLWLACLLAATLATTHVLTTPPSTTAPA